MQYAYFFKMQVDNQQRYHLNTDNYLCSSVPECKLNCSNEEVLNSLMFFIVLKIKLKCL